MQGRGGLEGPLWPGIELEQGKGKESLGEIDVAVKEQESPLKHTAINGALQGPSTAIGVNELKKVTKSFHVRFDGLTKALDMASRGRKKVEKQEN